MCFSKKNMCQQKFEAGFSPGVACLGDQPWEAPNRSSSALVARLIRKGFERRLRSISESSWKDDNGVAPLNLPKVMTIWNGKLTLQMEIVKISN